MEKMKVTAFQLNSIHSIQLPFYVFRIVKRASSQNCVIFWKEYLRMMIVLKTLWGIQQHRVIWHHHNNPYGKFLMATPTSHCITYPMGVAIPGAPPSIHSGWVTMIVNRCHSLLSAREDRFSVLKPLIILPWPIVSEYPRIVHPALTICGLRMTVTPRGTRRNL
jgi:hypothetical protein